jgi:CRISPR type III-B/RAMP module RAMP protein Cmr1
MEALRVRLETVTPLFLGGAEPRGSPEIRAPSLRGALRYWLRAALGESNLKTLKSTEADVFGDIQNASAVTVRAQSAAEAEGFEPTSPGLKYLFFSLKGDQQQEPRKCLGAGNEIDYQMFSRLKDRDAWLRACASLWLLTRLGGLGARSRRGAGALQPIGDGQLTHWPDRLPALNVRASSPLELVTELRTGLTGLRQALGASGSVRAPTEFDTLAPGACRIWVLNQAWRSWTTALNEVGVALQKARSLSSRGQIDLVRAARDAGTDLPDIDRAGLGLPIVFHDVEAGENVGTLQAIADEKAIERRASPLHIRVVKLNGGPSAYTVVLAWFNSRFAPDGSQLALRETTVTGALPSPTWMDTDFWPMFDEHTDVRRLEVRFQ